MIFFVAVLSFLISGAVGASLRADGDFCPLFCNTVPSAPVCGSDGKTYPNHCYFHKAQCHDPTLQMVNEGACIIVRRGIICTTPACMPTRDPVCGSDGVTYDNICFLNNAMCDNESLKMEHKGTCTPVFD